MINIIIGGRLGNQMFRYAMARAYMIKNNLIMYMNLTLKMSLNFSKLLNIMKIKSSYH